MKQTPLIEQNVAGQHIARALSLVMGDGRKYTVVDVEMATAIPRRTLWSWIATGEDRRTIPSDKLLVLMQFFGEEFTSKVLFSIGMGSHGLTLKHDAPMAVVATVAACCSSLAEFAADGVFDHIDRAKMEPIADNVIAVLQPFASRQVD